MSIDNKDGTKSPDYSCADLIWLLPIGALIFLLVMVVPILFKTGSGATSSYTCISSDKATCQEYQELRREQAELLQKLAIERLRKENREYAETLRSLSK